jgi:hypothetical protein
MNLENGAYGNQVRLLLKVLSSIESMSNKKTPLSFL